MQSIHMQGSQTGTADCLGSVYPLNTPLNAPLSDPLSTPLNAPLSHLLSTPLNAPLSHPLSTPVNPPPLSHPLSLPLSMHQPLLGMQGVQ